MENIKVYIHSYLDGVTCEIDKLPFRPTIGDYVQCNKQGHGTIDLKISKITIRNGKIFAYDPRTYNCFLDIEVTK